MEPEGIIEPWDAIVDGNRSANEGLKSRTNGVATSTSLVGQFLVRSGFLSSRVAHAQRLFVARTRCAFKPFG